MSEPRALNVDCLWHGNRVPRKRLLYQDVKGKVECGPWAVLLSADELYRFSTNRLQVTHVKRSDLCGE
jgi:hypothetical protein